MRIGSPHYLVLTSFRGGNTGESPYAYLSFAAVEWYRLQDGDYVKMTSTNLVSLYVMP